jgi:hypothetical protein
VRDFLNPAFGAANFVNVGKIIFYKKKQGITKIFLVTLHFTEIRHRAREREYYRNKTIILV